MDGAPEARAQCSRFGCIGLRPTMHMRTNKVTREPHYGADATTAVASNSIYILFPVKGTFDL